MLVALVAAGCAVLQQGVGGADVRAVVLVGYPVAFLVAYATRLHRPLILRVTVTAIAFVVLMTFAASLSSQSLGGIAALQIPLAEVFLWLMLVHSVDSPGRRSLLITLLSSTVLIAVAGVLSLSMAIVPFLLLWGLAAITALVLAQRSLVERLPALAPGAVRPKTRAAARQRDRRAHHPGRDDHPRHRGVHARPRRRDRPRAHVPGGAAHDRVRARAGWARQPDARVGGPVRFDPARPAAGAGLRSGTSGSPKSSTPRSGGGPTTRS